MVILSALVVLLVSGGASLPESQPEALRWIVEDASVQAIDSLRQAPAPVRDALADVLGPVADVGERFNPGCIVEQGVPGARLELPRFRGRFGVWDPSVPFASR